MSALHNHDGCEPSAEHFGVIYTVEGRPCCSAYEGEFRVSDGSFDRDAAERQCVCERYYFEAERDWLEEMRRESAARPRLPEGAMREDCNACYREFVSYGSPWCDGCIARDEDRQCGRSELADEAR